LQIKNLLNLIKYQSKTKNFNKFINLFIKYFNLLIKNHKKQAIINFNSSIHNSNSEILLLSKKLLLIVFLKLNQTGLSKKTITEKICNN
jgi:hypothetical protein